MKKINKKDFSPLEYSISCDEVMVLVTPMIASIKQINPVITFVDGTGYLLSFESVSVLLYEIIELFNLSGIPLSKKDLLTLGYENERIKL